MTRWPLIRHVRYLWITFCFWRWRRAEGMESHAQELLYLEDVWEGRA